VAKRGIPNVIDGLTSVRMAQHAGAGAKGPRLQPSRTKLPAAQKKPPPQKKPAEAKPGSRIGHTVVPERNEIVCHECGYQFVLQGRILKTYCPKCRSLLEMVNVVLDGEAAGSVRTIGTIEIPSSCRVAEGAELVAGRIIVAADARCATLRACSVLELRRGAQVDLARTTLRDLVVARGGRLSVTSRVECRNADIAGSLRARLFSSGAITLRSGSACYGELHGAHLVVEDGAGLKAAIFIGPAGAKAAAGGKE
jgi:cytoskeletal protein CcmA (bactofilin family)